MTQQADDALTRARMHLRRATLEGLEAAHALLEAAGQATGLDRTDAGALSAEIARGLERLLGEIRDGGRFELPPSLATPLDEALSREIERWEARSKQDPDARPVLRAFLGLRELLWEFGLGPAGAKSAPKKDRADPKSSPDPPERGRSRVQRFDVEG